MIGLTKSAALELGEHGITANAVAPTAVNTPMFRSSGTRYAIAEDVAPAAPPERLVAAGSRLLHPLRVLWVEPEDVAVVVVFLASDEARHVSGGVFDVTARLGGAGTA